MAATAVPDPMAIVGAACRFPSAADLTSFWTLLSEQGDAIHEVDVSRWPASRRPPIAVGGFLDAIEEFDAAAFAMSPVQAAQTDPQQRLILEIAVEALENARLGPADLSGSVTGVYVGIGASEYDARFIEPGAEIRGLHSGLGNDSSFAAGRIASLLGLRGPALSINTACSSALVAVDTALRDLRSGTCTIAIVGAVNLLVVPENSARLAQMGVLAPDGRCKPFDRSADGYGRAEGAGAIVLTTAEIARGLGLPTRAWVVGSAVNQDAGETGLTAPNPRAQRDVIASALAQAGLEADAIDVVEAHGTGTPAGDPVELQALSEAFAERSRPLPIGSAKSNIGHLEVAAGMAGILKAIGMLEGGRTLPHRVHDAPVPLPRPLCLAGSGLATEAARTPKTVGISAFGLSGTNAHVILMRHEPPAPPPPSHAERRPRVLVASASSPTTLRELASRLADAIEPTTSLVDLAASTALTRRALPHRLCLVAEDASEARAKLQRFAAEGSTDCVRTSQPHGAPLLSLLVGDLDGDWRPVIDKLRHWPAFAAIVKGVEDPTQLPMAVAAGVAAQWEAFGLSFHRIEGCHGGERAAAVIRGECTLSEAVDTIVHTEGPDTAHDDELIYVIGRVPLKGAFVVGPETTKAHLLESVARAWCDGVSVNWAAVHAPGFRRLALPPTPWQPVRAWIDEAPADSNAMAPSPKLPTYRRVWRPLVGLSRRSERRRWILIADHRGVASALATTLQPSPRVIRLGDGSADTVDIADPTGWANALGNLDDVAGVLFLAGLDQQTVFDDRPRPEAADDAIRSTWLAARWTRVLLEAMPPRRAGHERLRLLLATRGAVSIASDDLPNGAVDPTHGALWGLGATLALEHPELSVETVDLDPSGSLGGLAALLGVTLPERQVALRGERALAARLEPQTNASSSDTRSWGPGPVLVTGGLGALGLHLAEALVGAGVRTVWLAGRRPPNEDAVARLAALRRTGATVETFALDVADADEVCAWASQHAPTGWIHAAGVLDDGIALHLTPERTLAAMRPKVHGTLQLAHALGTDSLRAVAFCSSVAGLLGSMGQANYAAANTWLDAFAEAWRARGIPAVSVALGPLAGSGMAAQHEERLARAGVRALPLADTARAILAAAPGPGPVAVVDLDLERLAARGRPHPLLGSLLGEPEVRSEAKPAGPTQSREALLTWLTQQVGADLGLAPESLDPRRSLTWHGFDSLMAIELKRSLDAQLATSLPSTPFLSGPSLDELTDALAPLVVRAGHKPATTPPTFPQVPLLTALPPSTTVPGLAAVRLRGPTTAEPLAPLPVPAQVALGAMVAAALGIAWFLL